ncbi:MAG TPA: hypothetical protein VHA11_10330 [Bryobacteraceae bacterium]|nr:hypothetical protein [Bryobacteraceae bacterium]
MLTRFLFVATAVATLASADTLTLRDGRSVQGQYLGGNTRQVRMAVGDDVKTFDVTEVLNIQFETTKSASTAAPAAATAAAAPSAQAVGTAQAESAQAAPQQKILHVEPATPAPADPSAPATQLAAGTPVTVRMIDAVDSKQSRPGQTFRASVDEPVMAGDKTVIPKGADVVTRLVEMKDASKITGGGQLTLVLASITANGRSVDVTSESVTQAGESKTGDSAKVIGGTAALGAIIGAIAGGGKGAAIGAVAGGGAGTAVRVLTSGAQVSIPSETRLTFTLQSAVKI